MPSPGGLVGMLRPGSGPATAPGQDFDGSRSPAVVGALEPFRTNLAHVPRFGIGTPSNLEDIQRNSLVDVQSS